MYNDDMSCATLRSSLITTVELQYVDELTLMLLLGRAGEECGRAGRACMVGSPGDHGPCTN
jgi:hypothetical protein